MNTFFARLHFVLSEISTRAFLPVDGEAELLVAHLELENAESVPGVGVRTYEEFPGDIPPELWMLRTCSGRRVAIDRLDGSLLEDARSESDRLDLVDHARPERVRKQPEEIALIREATTFADMVLTRLLAEGPSIVRGGGTEAELMADCADHARTHLLGEHGDAFAGTKCGITASVHSGPRAALPHGAVTSRRPQPGDPIIAGIGCSLGGYHAESGVTLVVGQPTRAQLDVMSAMADATAATVSALERGAPCAEVDRAARDVLRSAGLGESLRHRIGHGMGIEGHEAPWLSPGDATPVEPGMVFSCEPGVYRPGLDGWRTIDTLIVGPEGVEVASSFLSHHPPERRVLAV
ncbi:MAG: Xaa-Pro peptidase family protein [Gemmatimonadota bacterium]